VFGFVGACGVVLSINKSSLSEEPENLSTLGMACAQAVAMRGAPSAARRLVAAPRNQQPFRFDPHAFDRDFRHIDDGV
jgi:hypothetical protein